MTEKKVTIKELPESEQPYEKCEKYGASVLSDGELLSVIIRTGSRGERVTDLVNKLLFRVPGQNLAGLFQISYEELLEIHGIGKVKALQILCICELVKRVTQSSFEKEKLLFDDPGRIAAYYMSSMRFLETEQVHVLMLNAKNVLIRDYLLSKGSFNSSFASPREIFYYALKYKAVSIILIHNHPSGDPSPSREDMMITKKVYDTGQMIGLPLLDHIVMGNNKYISFRECGYIS